MLRLLKRGLSFQAVITRRLFVDALRNGRLVKAAFYKTIPHMLTAIGAGFAAYAWDTRSAFPALSFFTQVVKWIAFVGFGILWLLYWRDAVTVLRGRLDRRPFSPISKLLKAKRAR